MLKYAAFIVGFVAISGVSAEARISANGVSLNGISLNGMQADCQAPDARVLQTGRRVTSVELPGHNSQK